MDTLVESTRDHHYSNDEIIQRLFVAAATQLLISYFTTESDRHNYTACGSTIVFFCAVIPKSLDTVSSGVQGEISLQEI